MGAATLKSRGRAIGAELEVLAEQLAAERERRDRARARLQLTARRLAKELDLIDRSVERLRERVGIAASDRARYQSLLAGGAGYSQQLGQFEDRLLEGEIQLLDAARARLKVLALRQSALAERDRVEFDWRARSAALGRELARLREEHRRLLSAESHLLAAPVAGEVVHLDAVEGSRVETSTPLVVLGRRQRAARSGALAAAGGSGGECCRGGGHVAFRRRASPQTWGWSRGSCGRLARYRYAHPPA